MNNKTRTSVMIDKMMKISQAGKNTKSVSLVRSSSANSYFGVQLIEALKIKNLQKKTRVIRTKVFCEKNNLFMRKKNSGYWF